MTCPKCRANQDRVIDSRERKRGDVIRRRRVCSCGHRWTTVEKEDIKVPKPPKPRRPRVYAINHHIL